MLTECKGYVTDKRCQHVSDLLPATMKNDGEDVDKDQSINDVLERLRSDLGSTAFDTVDQWDDLCAVAVARPSDHRCFVYICTFPPEAGTFAYECEYPPHNESVPYSSDGLVEEASYEDLLAAVRLHLRG